MTKNDDFHLMPNQKKPYEYFKDPSIPDAIDVSLNLSKSVN